MNFNNNLKEENNENYINIDGCIYTVDKKIFVSYPRERKETTFRFDDSVEEIKEYAVANSALESVYIGTKIKKIGAYALSNCESLRRVYIASADADFEWNTFDYMDYESYAFCPVCVGGQKGGNVEKHCAAYGINFIAIDESEVEDFFNATDKELEQKIDEQINLEGNITIKVPEEGFQLKIEGERLMISALDNYDSNKVKILFHKHIANARRERIKEIIIKDGIKSLDEWSLRDFYKLKSLYIGKDVEKINPKCFWRSFEFDHIEISEENKNFKAINSVIYSHDLKDLVLYPSGKKDELFIIPPFVQVIKENAFLNAFSLNSIEIGANVKEIEACAFYNVWLDRAYIDENVEKFGTCLFGVEDELRSYSSSYGLECGGKIGSPIEEYCKEEEIKFDRLEEKDKYQFLISGLQPTYSYMFKPEENRHFKITI